MQYRRSSAAEQVRLLDNWNTVRLGTPAIPVQPGPSSDGSRSDRTADGADGSRTRLRPPDTFRPSSQDEPTAETITLDPCVPYAPLRCPPPRLGPYSGLTEAVDLHHHFSDADREAIRARDHRWRAMLLRCFPERLTARCSLAISAPEWFAQHWRISPGSVRPFLCPVRFLDAQGEAVDGAFIALHVGPLTFAAAPPTNRELGGASDAHIPLAYAPALALELGLQGGMTEIISQWLKLRSDNKARFHHFWVPRTWQVAPSASEIERARSTPAHMPLPNSSNPSAPRTENLGVYSDERLEGLLAVGRIDLSALRGDSTEQISAFWEAIHLERCRCHQVRALMFSSPTFFGRECFQLKYDEEVDTFLDHPPHYTFSASSRNRELRELIFWIMEYLMRDMDLQNLRCRDGSGQYPILWDSSIHRWMRPDQWHVTGASVVVPMPIPAQIFNGARTAPSPNQVDYSWATSTPDTPYWGVDLVMRARSDYRQWMHNMWSAQEWSYAFGGSAIIDSTTPSPQHLREARHVPLEDQDPQPSTASDSARGGGDTFVSSDSSSLSGGSDQWTPMHNTVSASTRADSQGLTNSLSDSTGSLGAAPSLQGETGASAEPSTRTVPFRNTVDYHGAICEQPEPAYSGDRFSC